MRPHSGEGQSKVVRASSPETIQRAGPSLTQAGNVPTFQLHPLVKHLGDQERLSVSLAEASWKEGKKGKKVI